MEIRPKWQRAKIKEGARADLIGRFVWTEIDGFDTCRPGCSERCIRVNHTFENPLSAFLDIIVTSACRLGLEMPEGLPRMLDGELQDVMHLSELEMLDEFEFDDLPLILWRDWLAGKER